MDAPMIEIEGLGKKYRISTLREPYLSLRDSMTRRAAHMWNVLRGTEQVKSAEDDFWALKDVSFSVRQGESVGIIGRNGAGKSTLLKILSQITPPTEGRITMYGRVASLLEVGTGFHPELSGRENIFLNGAILGMTRGEIRKKFDEIVAFAEVEQFLDTPVKRYSSGMYVRLAFAVAAHLEPEILVVDEVLAVGDAEFQKKCLGKMSEVAREGRTVLFVSHNMAAVQSLCQRAILLAAGRLQEDGEVNAVVSKYYTASTGGTSESVWELGAAPSTEHIVLTCVRLYNANGAPGSILQICDPISIDVEFEVLTSELPVGATLILTDSNGAVVFSSLSSMGGIPLSRHERGKYIYTCTIHADLLNAGRYSIGVILWTTGYKLLIREMDVLSFFMLDAETSRGDFLGSWLGAVRPRLAWSLSSREPERSTWHE